MSEIQIALVAEGPTDYIIIEAALRAVLPVSFVLTQLQPEPTRPSFGNGWCGVLKWCHYTGKSHAGPLDNHPLLARFDVIIIHTDADVAGRSYGDCGSAIASNASSWGGLPCHLPCPPAANTVVALRSVVASWLAPACPGPNKTVICIPAQASGAWLAAAVLPAGHTLLTGLTCNTAIESHMGGLPKKDRIKKSQVAYRANAHKITSNWNTVKSHCDQASDFEHDIGAAI